MGDYNDDGYDDQNGGEWQGEDEFIDPFATTLDDILREVGADSAEFFLVDITEVDPANLRGQAFDTLEEVVLFLFDIGVINFGGVYYDPEDDRYYPYIGDSGGNA